MKLSISTLNTLSEMICGESGGFGNPGYKWEHFPYRSSSSLTKFFRQCDLGHNHDGSTRQPWVYSILEEINNYPSTMQVLPSEAIIRVLENLANPIEFAGKDLDHQTAIHQINNTLHKDGLQITIRNNQVIVENLTTQVTSHTPQGRLLSREENRRYQSFAHFLETASEDDFTEQILQNLFKALGFEGINIVGHHDRGLEYGKDLWMKYRMPTKHQLYIGVQVKKGKIHASGSELKGNVSGILAQLLMLMTYPVFDPETNTKHLFDHVFLVSSGEITKQARELLSEFLDKTMRRNVMFMDKEDILELCVKYSLPLPDDDDSDLSNTVTDTLF